MLDAKAPIRYGRQVAPGIISLWQSGRTFRVDIERGATRLGPGKAVHWGAEVGTASHRGPVRLALPDGVPDRLRAALMRLGKKGGLALDHSEAQALVRADSIALGKRTEHAFTSTWSLIDASGAASLGVEIAGWGPTLTWTYDGKYLVNVAKSRDPRDQRARRLLSAALDKAHWTAEVFESARDWVGPAASWHGRPEEGAPMTSPLVDSERARVVAVMHQRAGRRSRYLHDSWAMHIEVADLRGDSTRFLLQRPTPPPLKCTLPIAFAGGRDLIAMAVKRESGHAVEFVHLDTGERIGSVRVEKAPVALVELQDTAEVVVAAVDLDLSVNRLSLREHSGGPHHG